MRVLLISHTCQSRTEGQPRAQCLGAIGDIELRLLTPDRWLHYGQWRAPQVPAQATFRYQVGKVMWPSAGPAQSYLHWYPALARLLREFRPDIIDLWEEPWSLVSAHTCWLRGRLLPQAKIISETEQNINKKLPPPFEQFRSYTLRHADYVVGRNSEAIELVRGKGYGGPASVVPNAVDAELFARWTRRPVVPNWGCPVLWRATSGAWSRKRA
jgi:glycosyltransferase involved in cell wall biosynthesis